VINKVLLKHETPALDDVEHRLLERFCVNSEPRVEHGDGVNLFHLAVYFLVCVDLSRNTDCLNFFIKKEDKASKYHRQ